MPALDATVTAARLSAAVLVELADLQSCGRESKTSAPSILRCIDKDKNKRFSSSVYKLLTFTGVRCGIQDSIWRSVVRLFGWLVANLVKKHIRSEDRCELCKTAGETTNHLLFGCPRVATTDDSYVEDGHILESPNLRIFTFAELSGACNNFKPETLLGEGGFGKVYKGWIDVNSAKGSAAMVVAVKKFNPESVQGMEQWQVYFLLSCQILFVIKFPIYLGFGTNSSTSSGGAIYKPLTWSLRLKILIGAARGLAFLHSSERQIIYRDFKASNILLDSHFNPKLSDFGLPKHGPDDGESHVTTRVMGTYRYVAPEYVSTGMFSI
ncbi:putative serine/threonine-protein kinase Cx32, chloroplastic [Hordeum vulgare]|nr:putative serine/threonine-protein kinase Cx32, chloroplastic [Hordeum vulgare]